MPEKWRIKGKKGKGTVSR